LQRARPSTCPRPLVSRRRRPASSPTPCLPRLVAAARHRRAHRGNTRGIVRGRSTGAGHSAGSAGSCIRLTWRYSTARRGCSTSTPGTHATQPVGTGWLPSGGVTCTDHTTRAHHSPPTSRPHSSRSARCGGIPSLTRGRLITTIICRTTVRRKRFALCAQGSRLTHSHGTPLEVKTQRGLRF